ncbi:hypothetical protein [Acinetobacter sp. YH12252]|uniref:hypothetical protein n=1 Tax=Acinetobacter sp. YH12252 TaxID=2601177 RepID=UPI0015D23C7C|nr:hypothetical protein [Acinetobacter sp. YH12252]
MKTLYLFKLFCFSAAGLSFYHLYTELTRNHVDTFQVMTLTGLVVLLVELGYRSQLAVSMSHSSGAMSEVSASSNYSYFMSKLAASSIATCFIVQSWMA